MKDIKILMACHKEEIHFPDNDLIFPIQVGSALSAKRFDGMLHDDEGDNISDKNRCYCELTALYWAWKNIQADYVGLFHYRRYLSFSDQHFTSNYFGDVLLDTNDDDTLDAIGFNEQQMRSIIEDADIILPEKSGFLGKPTLREQYNYAKQHKIEDLDVLCEIISEKNPEMADILDRVFDAKEGYFCNMFIMRKDIFDRYCEWLFPILEEHEKRRDYSDYDPASYRVSGYLSERMLNVFIEHLRRTEDYKIKELQRVFFEDVDQPKLLEPAFEDIDAVKAVFSANDFYVPYLSALLQSIKDNSNPQRKYDLVVMTDDISARHQRILSEQIKSENISLRFFNVSYYMRNRGNDLALRGHFRIQTYFRLLLQDILPSWDKVLYLDSDMIVLDDIADLYDEDVDGYLLAAAKDADTAGLYNGYQKDKKQYMDEILKIKNPYEYFQAGTILFNLDKFRELYTVDELFKFASSYEWQLLDQDVLNYFAQGLVKFIPMKWNVMMDWGGFRIKKIIGRAPKYLVEEYLEAHSAPAICHYAGPDKPWEDPDTDLAEFFWLYSRKTPFYEVALKRMCTRVEPKPSVGSRVKQKIKPTYEKIFPAGTKSRERVGNFLATVQGKNDSQ